MDRTGARFSSVRPLWSIASSKALNRRPAGRAADALPIRAQSENRKGDGAQRTEHAARTCRRGGRIAALSCCGALGRYWQILLQKSFSLVIKNSPGCRRDFLVKM